MLTTEPVSAKVEGHLPIGRHLWRAFFTAIEIIKIAHARLLGLHALALATPDPIDWQLRGAKELSSPNLNMGMS